MNVFLQAQEFSVAFLAPSAQSVILGNNWSSRARNRFITLVHGRSFMVTLYSIVHSIMRVHVYVSMEAGDISVADLLVQEGHARLAPESFESKVTQEETINHIMDLKVWIWQPLRRAKNGIKENRHILSVCLLQQSHEVLTALYQDLSKGNFTPSSTSSSWKNRKEEEKRLIDSLLLSYSKSSNSAPKCKVPKLQQTHYTIKHCFFIVIPTLLLCRFQFMVLPLLIRPHSIA